MRTRFRLIRPGDLLVADVELVNLTASADGRSLERITAGEPAQVILRLPAQHLPEQVAYDQVPHRVALYASGPSVLAFGVPDDVERLPLSVAGLLDPRLTLSPVPRSFPPDGDDPTVYQGIQRTAVEFPARLLLTPDLAARWEHRTEPYTVDGRTELWHSRLVPDFPGPLPLRAFAALLNRPHHEGVRLQDQDVESIVMLSTRQDLVRPTDGELLMAGWQPEDWPVFGYTPEPLEAKLLVVSALGGSMRLHGSWDYPDDIINHALLRQFGWPVPSVQAYDHVATLGRDSYVRVVRRGHLNTGHRASVVQVFRRQFEPHPITGEPIAVLRGEDHLVVQGPEVSYHDAGFPFQGREMPFRSLRISDTVTPTLVGYQPGVVCWVMVDSGDYRFTLTGTDAEGRQLTFTAPLLFVPNGAYYSDVSMVFDRAEHGRNVWNLGGQPIALAAPETPDGGVEPFGATCHSVESIRMEMTHVDGHSLGSLPRMREATARIASLEQLTGARDPVGVTLHDSYLNGGITGHPSGAYLQLAQEQALVFAAERVGGLAKPDLSIGAVSTKAGALPAALATPDLAPPDPATLFGNAKLLGTVALSEVLGTLEPGSPDAFPGTDEELRAILDDPGRRLTVPLLRTRLLPGGGAELRYVWKPKLRSFAPLTFGEDSALVLDASTTRGADGVVTSTVTGELTHFDFSLAGVVSLHIDRLVFRSVAGGKPEITVAGLDLAFAGDLRFINTLRDLFRGGFGGGTSVEVGAGGITAGYGLSIPAAGVGVFSLANLALSAVLSIPFNDDPARFRFALSSPHDPFNISVSLFGGGGFFALTVDSNERVALEGALEFGGSASLDLGVASGGIYLMGGIYFAFNDIEGLAVVSGYLRCGGHLSVLGIVSIAVEFRLALGYRETAGGRSEVWGQASMTVSVRIAFVSKSVTLSMERSFAGADGDPSFEDCVEPDDWDDYCLAFAS